METLITVTWVLVLVQMLVAILEFRWSSRARRAVKGSHERYVLLTKRRVASWAYISTLVALALVFILRESYVVAGLEILFAYLSIKTELKRDDDDWFNGRWKKIKAGLKTFAKSLVPKPMGGLSPVGA